MISRLKTRPRVDSATSEPRRARYNWDRLVYLVLLGAFVLAMLNYALGDRLILRAHGLVLYERDVLEATSLVRVSEVHVRPGERVEAGDVLLEAQSFEILGRLADLAMREAELAERQAALRSRIDVAERLLPVQRARLADVEARQDDLAGRKRVGPATAAMREATGRDVHDARIGLARVEVEASSLPREDAAISAARAQARGAIGQLEAHYAGGVHRSGTSGVVGDTVPARGEVFRPGEPLLTVLSGRPYVLAYLPEAHLFAVRTGTRVRLTGSHVTHLGTVTRILPVSQSLPDEFRNTFKLDETRQLARIRLDDAAPFPAFSAVRIARLGGWSDPGGLVTAILGPRGEPAAPVMAEAPALGAPPSARSTDADVARLPVP